MVRRSLALIAFAAALGCEGAAPLLGSNDEPLVNLLLSADPGSDSTLRALVAGGTTSAQLRYGNVESFTMQRRSDGAMFDWKVTPRSGILPLSGGSLTEVANIRLAWLGSGSKLGRSQLTKGDTYDLDIVVDGKHVTGSATIPKAIAITVQGIGAGSVATWNASSPGTLYDVSVSVDNTDDVNPRDTTYTVKGHLPRQYWFVPPRITVTAVDSNYARFQADFRSTAAFGISGARGVFVGVARASALLNMGPP